MHPAEAKNPLVTPLGTFETEDAYLQAYYAKLQETQACLAQLIPPGRSLVDELIADRREEGKRFWSKAS